MGGFFLEEDEVSGCWNKWRGSTWGPRDRGRALGGGRTPLSCGSHVGPLHLFQHTCTSSSSRKNHPVAQTRVLAHFAAIFDLFVQSSICKTVLGDCSSVCDSSIGPTSVYSSALFIANLCCLGDPVLELACQIYMVKSSF